MLSLQGILNEHPFPRLLNFLHEADQTGRLLLKHSGVSKTVYVVQGLAVNVESSLRDETLGRYLIKQGKITEDDYKKSIELMMEQGIQQGASLVKLGALKPREFYQAVKNQTREKLLTCFGWSEGEYHYQEEISFVEDIYRFEMPLIPIMREGLVRFFPGESLDRELALVPDGPLIPESDLLEKISGWNLGREESAIVLQIDGQKGLREILSSAGAKEKRLFYLLLLVGLIKPSNQLAEKLREVIPGELHAPQEREALFVSVSAPEVIDEEAEGVEKKRGEDEILTEYMEIKSKDYFSLLDVDTDADDERIEQAYHRKMAEFARDCFVTGLSAEAEARLEEINTQFIRAYESLRDSERREKYRQELPGKAQAGAKPGLEAERILQRGMEYVRARDWAKAQEMFEKAVELRPEEPEYFGYLGWAIYSNEELEFEQRRDMAIEKLARAIEMNPNMDSIHVFMGKIYKDSGNVREAIAEFRLALRCNPNCHEAARELKAHGVET
jgi:tetratricopeptide (TPR) repeat protein